MRVVKVLVYGPNDDHKRYQPTKPMYSAEMSCKMLRNGKVKVLKDRWNLPITKSSNAFLQSIALACMIPEGTIIRQKKKDWNKFLDYFGLKKSKKDK